MIDAETQGHRLPAVRGVLGQSSWLTETTFYEAFCSVRGYHRSRQRACLGGGEDG